MTVYWGTHGALNANANPVALLLGDSWFWYPADDLAVEIGAGFPDKDFLVIGRNGSEAAEWSTKYRKEIDLAFKMYGQSVQALLLSGGGNDIAGMSDFLRIVADNCSKASNVQACYRIAQPDEILSTIIGSYRSLITKFRAYNPTAPVFTHNYDNAWPSGKGLFGPADWLKAPMDKAKVPKNLRVDLFKNLLKRLRDAQLDLAKTPGLGPVNALASAGTMPDDEKNKEQWWANELHPTPKGFALLAKKVFIPSLKKVIV